ncbi:MAG: NAD(P)-binding domain-containing protein [Leptospiraceae bacterium]|nr:NAD(P)-binding domain-containing protein [Leptospiraceae bacterium]
MKIGIIGSGTVGQALAMGFLKHGYEVMIGSRNATKLTEFARKSAGKIQTGDFAATAAFGEILVNATKGSASKEALRIAGADHLAGKPVIDAANPIADVAPEKGVLKFFTNLDQSLMEELQSEFPAANFVKAFSCIGSAGMVNPDFGGVKPSMFIAGNDAAAKSQVKTILDQFGFEVEDMGGVEAARAIEPLCMLWCIPGFKDNRWNHAFKLLK